MILEGIVTTISAAGEVNIAPMGPRVDADMRRFLLRPFNTSTTYHNLRAHGEGVLHVTDDVMLLARTALGQLDPLPALVPAQVIRGWILRDACRFYEFRVVSIDDREERVSIEVEVVHHETLREFFGFNRAKHAVVEAAILATRTDFLPIEEIEAEYRKLAVIVQKTGGDEEKAALEFLRAHVARQLSSPLGKGEEGKMIRIRTASRLHFGLFSLPSENAAGSLNQDDKPTSPRRQFGGVGLMVERPGIDLAVEPAPRWSAEGPLAERALQFAQIYCSSVGIQESFHLRVESASPEHAGFGTGTQLGLAVARALAELTNQPVRDAIALARQVNRGARSAVGVHGFDRGGLLVEAGKLNERAISPLLLRHDFPGDWHVLLITPRDLVGVHSRGEIHAFATLARQPPDDRTTESLCRLVLLGMLPALIERDLNTFGEALYEFNRRVGEMFVAAQGGVYADPRIEAIIKTIRLAGVACVGQSSWGPTVFAIARREKLVDLYGGLKMLGVGEDQLVLTKACNHGAAVNA